MKQMFLVWVGLLALSMPMDAGAGGDKQKQSAGNNHAVSHAGKRKAPEMMLKNSTEKLSYAFGMQVADSLKQGHMKIDIDRFILGFKDSLEGRKALLSPKKAKKFRDRFYEKKRQLLAEKNLATARKFLTENRRRKGITTASSGLQGVWRAS